MIIDLSKADTPGDMECDVAIVGSGAAGVVLALTLAREGLNVILVEAGGLKSSAESQDFFKGDVGGHRDHALDEMRQRCLGGTTTTWGGRCIPLDPIDFEHRDCVAHSGWPISYDEVARYFPEALGWCHAGRAIFSAAQAGLEPLIDGLEQGDILTDQLERWSLPTDFGRDYLPELSRQPNLRLCLNAPCTNIELDKRYERVARIGLTAGQHVYIKSREYVLAAGGLEIPRILLNANSQKENGVGNDSNQVGRYYMGHLTGSISEIVLNPSAGRVAYDYQKDEGVYVRSRLSLSEGAQRRESLPNFGGLLGFPLIGNPSHRSGLLSSVYFAKYFLGMKSQIPQTLMGPDSFQAKNGKILAGHIRNLFIDLPNVIRYMPPFMIRRFVHKRRIPSMIPPVKGRRYPLHYLAEQTPNPNSRIALSQQQDKLGLRRIKVDFQVARGDAEKVKGCHDVIGRSLEKNNVGRLDYVFDDPEEGIVSQYHSADGHFIGTTRMGDNPQSSVVNADCRVHGIGNLYIAGSSVFPTSGQANPTLSIVALSLRLAEHLLASKKSQVGMETV